MKKMVLTTVAGAALIASTVSGAFAADHTTPGTPGTSNCEGQTTAYIAQAAKTSGLEIDEAFHGIGGIGRYFDLTPEQLHEVIAAYCAS